MRLRTWLTFMLVRSCSCCVLSPPIFEEAVLDVLLAQLGAYSPCAGDWLLVRYIDAFDFWFMLAPGRQNAGCNRDG